MGDLGGDTRVVRIGSSLKVRGDPEVHAPSFGRQQLLVDGLPDQAVAKAVCFGAAVIHQESPIDGLLNGDADLGQRQARQLDQQVVVHWPVADGRRGKHARRVVRQPCRSRLDDLADRSGQPSGMVGNRQLFEEECIPAAAADDLRDDRRA